MRTAPSIFSSFALFLAVFLVLISETAIAQNTVPVTSGMILRYAFGGDNRDSSVNRNDLDTGGIYVADRHGRGGQALFLSGATQLTAANTLSIGRDFSVSSWIKLASLPPAGPPFGELWAILSIEGPANLYFNLGVSGDSGVGFRFESGGNPQPFLNYQMDNSFVDEWKHIAVTRNDFMLKLFIDGMVVDSVVTNQSLVDGLSNPLFVGGSTLISRFGLDGYYRGALDEVRIYDRPLNQAEIDTLAEQLPVAVRPRAKNTKVGNAEVWERSRFATLHGNAVLTDVKGLLVNPQSAMPGLYVWQDGPRRKRLILQ